MNNDGAIEEFSVWLTTPDDSGFDDAVAGLVEDRVASRIAGRDHTLWGPAAEAESAQRLAWVGLAQQSRPLVADILALKERFNAAGLTHVVLCGMGGSSLAPEVICATHGVELTVLDSSDPDYVRAALADRLGQSIVVISSKSGGTVETDSQRRAYEQAFVDFGRDSSDHIVVVTDPGSPLERVAVEAGYTVFHADPEVGGRYSALTAFGLVPSGLAGADIGRLLDEAAAVQPMLEADTALNPGLQLGALLGVANRAGVDKLALADDGSGIPGFGDWAEQLVAESTGKDGTGILPVVVESTSSPNFDPSTSDEILLTVGDAGATVAPASGYAGSVTAALGAQFLIWEYATAVAGRLIGISPFDQPDVESAKAAAREMLEGTGAAPSPAFVDGAVAVYGSPGLLPDGVSTVAGAVDALLGHLGPDTGYLAVMAYLDRVADGVLASVRTTLARRTSRPVTFGWGPRFLHSTGQYHKGGSPTGVFLQITSAPRDDLEIPGRPFTFGGFISAQAIGDGAVLSGNGRPVLRLHLTEHDAGFETVHEVLSR